MTSRDSRLLYLTERYPPDPGGMAVSCGRQVEGLRRRGFRLDVIALTAAVKENKIREAAKDGGTDYYLGREPRPGTSAQVAWQLIQEQSAKNPYDWIIGFGANLPGFLAVTFAAWLSRPSLCLVRGNDFDRDWFDDRAGFLVKEALGRATVIGAVSPEKAEKIRALFPGKEVRWTPNGVDAAPWELLPEDRRRREAMRAELGADGRRVVGLFGEMKFKKRVPLWLSALRDTGLMKKVGLLIVGRVDEETGQLLSDPSLAPINRQLAFCPREQLPGLYAACDFLCLPSLFDGLPNVLLEAMACGVIPIASDAGAIAEVIEREKNGFLFPAEDRAAAAQVTAKALALNDQKLSAMKQAAKDRVTNYFSVTRELDLLSDIILSKEIRHE